MRYKWQQVYISYMKHLFLLIRVFRVFRGQNNKEGL